MNKAGESGTSVVEAGGVLVKLTVQEPASDGSDKEDWVGFERFAGAQVAKRKRKKTII